MINLDEIWEGIKLPPLIKMFGFDTPEEATDYLKENIILKLNEDTLILDVEGETELTISQAIDLIDRYCKYQNIKIHLEFESKECLPEDKSLEVYLECWGLQSDCDCYADVLTISFNSSK